MPSFVGNLQKWTIHKTHKKTQKCAEYQLYIHDEGEEHLGLQFLLSGILDVYYDKSRNHGQKPGFVSFPEKKIYKRVKVEIPYDK